MEDFGQIIGYVIFILMVVVPRLLQMLGRKNTALDADKQPRPKPVAKPDPPIPPELAAPVAARAREIFARGIELQRLCELHQRTTAPLAAPIAQMVQGPLTATLKSLESFTKGESKLTASLLRASEVLVDRHSRLVALLEHLVEQRIMPGTAGQLQALDALAQDCLLEWIDAATDRGLTYPSRRAVVLLGEPCVETAELLSQAMLAPVVVPAQKSDRVEGLISIPHGIALDLILSVPGLMQRLERYSPGNEQLLHLGANFDAKQFTAVLAADTVASLSMGPSYCAGLCAVLESSAEIQIEAVPSGLRLYAACLAVELAGHANEGQSRLERIFSRVEDFSMPQSLLPYADAIVRDTLGVIASATGIGTNPERQKTMHAKMERLADELAGGSLLRAPTVPKELLGGTLLAYETKPAQESRLVHGLLSTLAPPRQTTRTPQRAQTPSAARSMPSSDLVNPRRYLSNPALAAQAIVAQAALSRPLPARAFRQR
jgi:hypothetical protein